MASPAARTHAPDLVESPTLRALTAALRGGDEDAPDRLWERARRGGGPLVEALPGDPEHRAVSFLWRDAEDPAPDVLLLLDTVTDRHRDELGPAILRPIEGSGLRAATYRLRADVRASYGFHVARRIAPDLGRERSSWWEVLRSGVPDPLNPDRLPAPGDREVSILSLPDAPPQPWRHATGEPRGTVERHLVPTVHLAPRPEDATTDGRGPRATPTDDGATPSATGRTRETWVYLPPGDAVARAGSATAPLDVAVLLDGDVWGAKIPIAPTLDALIAAGAIPPLCVLMPHSLDGPTRMGEMGMDDALVRFLTDELLPWAADRWPLTADAARTVVAGQSMGGLAALFTGFSAPDRFGAVLSQSGSYWWPEDDDGTQHERAVAWLRDRAPDAADPRVWMEVGRHEWMLLDSNLHARDALARRGVDLTFREYGGGHDYACWRGGLADGLVALLG